MQTGPIQHRLVGGALNFEDRRKAKLAQVEAESLRNDPRSGLGQNRMIAGPDGNLAVQFRKARKPQKSKKRLEAELAQAEAEEDERALALARQKQTQKQAQKGASFNCYTRQADYLCQPRSAKTGQWVKGKMTKGATGNQARKLVAAELQNRKQSRELAKLQVGGTDKLLQQSSTRRAATASAVREKRQRGKGGKGILKNVRENVANRDIATTRKSTRARKDSRKVRENKNPFVSFGK